MIIVHHLEQSRSQRILWLMEELGVPYEIKRYARNPQTRFAPPELKQIHPLGKSPAVEQDGKVLAESGAIIEYLADTQGDGKLAVPAGHPKRFDYLHWLHHAEGSAVLPLMLLLYTGMLGEAAAPLQPRIASEIDNHLSYANNSIGGGDYFVDHRFTAADIAMTFISDFAAMTGKLSNYPNLVRAREAHQQRPAHKRALENGA